MNENLKENELTSHILLIYILMKQIWPKHLGDVMYVLIFLLNIHKNTS